MIRILAVIVLGALVQLVATPSFASCPDTHYPCGNACCSK